jgi:hypothetical protein
MSSPTISLPQGSQDTSLETIMNLVRALVNDSQAGATGTAGEGQIFTDNPEISPFTQPFLNSSIRELYRELRNVGQPTLIKDNVIISNLPVMNSPTQGLGVPDPAVQTFLSVNGYFDGVKFWPNLLLPTDLLYPEEVWERCSNTNNVFCCMTQAQFGLSPCYQCQVFGQWEWRNNNINFNGALEQRDIRLRYYASLPTFFSQTLNFSTTYVPILDCTDAVAYKTAVKYARMLGSPGLADLAAEAKEQMFQLKNANTRRSQGVNYERIPFGNSDSDINNDWYCWGWQ